ncbi:MAG: hypothetical protein WC178_02205 [Candidatus Paceibacterota bacterium]
MNYEIFHDESKKDGYWHGLLFVPEDNREKLIEQIKYIRGINRINDTQRLDIKGVGNKKRNRQAIQMLLNFFVITLKGRIDQESKIIYKSNFRDDRSEYKEIKIDYLYNIKFFLLKERDGFKKMNKGLDFGQKAKITFKFALKGGGHYLFDKENPINIKKIYFDGHEHYRRRIEKEKITENLTDSLREYCVIDRSFEVDDRQRKDRQDDTKFIMDFIDNIIGSWRKVILEEKEDIMFNPIKDVFNRFKEGRIGGDKNCRWFKSFSLSECYLENEEWHFDNFSYKRIKPENEKQQSLF